MSFFSLHFALIFFLKIYNSFTGSVKKKKIQINTWKIAEG